MSGESDIAIAFKEMKEKKNERKANRLASANDDGWSKHSYNHWYRYINGKKVDYWPSTGRVRYNGKSMTINGNRFKKIMQKGVNNVSV